MTPGLARALRLLACPVCSGGLSESRGSLRCERNHCFDISRRGYVNLLLSKPPADYGREMLLARRESARAGLWIGVTDAVAELAARHSPDGPVLDAGCGDGSGLDAFPRDAERVFAGLDISRDAVSLAAASGVDICWVVGDLSRAPFAGGSFGLILNFLSPAHYHEFSRLLRPGGVLIKTVPGKGYLRELREVFFDDSRKTYSPEAVEGHFEERFELIDRVNVSYVKRVEHRLIPALIGMTPLSWNADPEKKRLMTELDGLDVSVDMSIMVGRPL